MQITGLKIVKADIAGIRRESEKLFWSRTALEEQTQILADAGDAMLNHSAGEFRRIYLEVENFMRDKMGLLCDVVGGLAEKNRLFAQSIADADNNAKEKLIEGGIRR